MLITHRCIVQYLYGSQICTCERGTNEIKHAPSNKKCNRKDIQFCMDLFGRGRKKEGKEGRKEERKERRISIVELSVVKIFSYIISKERKLKTFSAV